ncbi:MAG: hypothetical protein C5B49_05005 [Bdellovibrio sp.]|nr:MAG: hypothetical protein C5B49_05005 [Bdellovibrio sp.]
MTSTSCLGRVFLALTTSFFLLSPGNSFAQDSSLPPGSPLVSATITTNYTEMGLTQTQFSPAIQASLGYKWPQFSVGVWGSNVKFPTNQDTINFRPFIAYRFIITSAIDLTMQGAYSKYGPQGASDQNIFSMDFNIMTYRFLFEQVNNWEATGDWTTRLGLMKDFELRSWLFLALGGGYVRPLDAHTYGDFLLSVGYKLSEMRFDFGMTTTTDTTQMNGRGAPAMFIKFSVTPSN